ncbi:MAG TPA: molybdenum cofactor guanylyltransferase [Candidatus Acidoferrales bacterium]|nr:molybdenum cofactor guanylyltransferase [Candidatus Acidoferrales bacterium]
MDNLPREAIGTFILAGGRSSRMGSEKGLLPFAGKPLVLRMARLVEFAGDAPVIIGPPGKYGGFGFRVMADDQRGGVGNDRRGVGIGGGPLVGICTALRIATRGWNLIVACDLPFLTREWLEFLIARALDSPADVVIPLNERGYEPLCAMYRKRCHTSIAAAFSGGVRKVTDGLAGLTISAIAREEWKGFDPSGRLFKNVNTPADYDEARTAAEEKS